MFGNIKKYFFFLLDATGPVLDLEAREVLDLNVTLEGQSCWLKGFCLTRDCFLRRVCLWKECSLHPLLFTSAPQNLLGRAMP